MSDSLCVGVCMIDPDTGACLGCGRSPEEIDGVPVPPSVSPAAAVAPLPSQVSGQMGPGSD